MSILGEDGAQPPDFPPQLPPPDTCESCVGAGMAWSADTCVEDCRIIADAACYTDQQGCFDYRQSVAVSELCNGQTSCVSCADAHDDCGWDSEESTCYSLAGIFFIPPTSVFRNSAQCAQSPEGLGE